MEEYEPGRMSPGGYSGEEMDAFLAEGARRSGSTPDQAAVHLLLFTDAPRRMAFDRNRHLVDVDPPAAYIFDWTQLVWDRGLGLSYVDRRMIKIAASLGGYFKVDLDEELRNMGHAHARRIAEAILIRTGMTGLLTVAGTPELAKLQALQSELSGGPS